MYLIDALKCYGISEEDVNKHIQCPWCKSIGAMLRDDSIPFAINYQCSECGVSSPYGENRKVAFQLLSDFCRMFDDREIK